MNMKDILNQSVVLFGLSCYLSQLQAGDDVIFTDGFDLTGSQLNCPDAVAMSSMIDELGNEYFEGEGIISYVKPSSYFSVDFEALAWYELDVFAQMTPWGSQLLLSLFDNDGGELLAQNTDRIRRGDQFIYRSLSTAGFCLKVEYNPLLPPLEPSSESFGFVLTNTPINFQDMEAYDFESEPNDELAQANDIQSWVDWDSLDYTHVLGGFNSADDVDIFRITTSNETRSLLINNYSDGLNADGIHAGYNKLEIITNNGVDVMAELNPKNIDRIVLLPVVNNTDYYVRLSLPEQPLAVNPYYVLELETNDYGYQQELDNLTNDSAEGAEVAQKIIFDVSPTPPVNLYTIAGNLSGSSDVDWWQFEVDPYSELSVYCYSAHHGSAVINAEFEVYSNPTLSALQAEVENPNTGVVWSDYAGSTMPSLVLDSNETHYLRIAANQFSGDIIGRFYSCSLYVTN